jgi:hypothetical protein
LFLQYQTLFSMPLRVQGKQTGSLKAVIRITDD